jgi:hypothetical protein
MSVPLTTAPPARPRPWYSNPIIQRYVRSRLRPQAVLASMLVVGMVAGFIYFMARTTGRYRGLMDVIDAERTTLVPLLVLQVVILFFAGTGQVAAGITAEADEGTIDYQRLSPLTPLAKVFGYLFGLPVREWFQFAITLPFTAMALWKGQVPFSAWAPVYGIMISSALLYHLTGLVAGSVLKNRRWAFLISIAVIFLLYTILPQMAKFGLVYFKYLTLWPVIDENIHQFIPREAGGLARLARALEPDVRFFGLHFSEAIFTLVSQGVISLTFVVMLWRRWRKAESHLLGKVWAIGVFAWMQLMLLGNALPLIAPGLLFPSRQFSRRFNVSAEWKPDIMEALAMISLYGIVTLLLLLVLTFIITPSIPTQIQGLQRMRKLGWKRLPLVSDPASAVGPVILMAITGAVGWTIFARELIGSTWFPGHGLSVWTGGVFALVLLGGGLLVQSILEGWGGRRLFLAGAFGAVAPLLIGGVISTINNQMLTAAVWIAGISPLSWPAYATASHVPTLDLPPDIARALPRSFGFWLFLTWLVMLWLQRRLTLIRRQRREAAESGMSGDRVASPPGGI